MKTSENRACRRSTFVFLLLWGLLLLWYWTGLPADEAFLYGLTAHYIVLPPGVLVTALVWGRYGGRARFAVPFILTGMTVLLGMLTFDLSNTLAFGHWNLPDLELAPFTLLPALFGLAVGLALRSADRRRAV